MPNNCDVIAKWAVRMPDMGPAVYRLTDGNKEHKHAYHIFCPWSPDGNTLLLTCNDRINPEAEVCAMKTATGEICPIGTCRKWSSHSVAFQQWVGNKNRILYFSEAIKHTEFVAVNPDGTDEKIYTPNDFNASYCSFDGKFIYGATPLQVLFPDDKIAPRHDKGIIRYNLDTGEQELIFSIENALKLLPKTNEYGNCHLYAKMVLVHPKSGRIMFNFTNAFWDRDGTEPQVRSLITVDTDGSNAAYLGKVVHHPNWHPVEDRVIGNVRDFNGKLRFGIYQGDGSGLLEYVPQTKGSGHPSLSPDGKWICTDSKSGAGFDNSLILCDPDSGKEIFIAKFTAVSDGYSSFKAVDRRADGVSIAEAIFKSNDTFKAWQAQAHPAWSRDGSAILFNRDAGDGKGSQLYMIDVKASVAALT